MFIARSSRAVGVLEVDDDSRRDIESVSRDAAFKSAAFTSQFQLGMKIYPSPYFQILVDLQPIQLDWPVSVMKARHVCD